MNVFDIYTSTALTKQVIDWKDRVISAGGTLTSDTIRCANYFTKDLIKYGLIGSIGMCNFFAPDNITSSFVPLIGGTIWTNFGFVAADLSINGLQGNGSKYFLASQTPTQSLMVQTSGHLSCYITSGSVAITNEIGSTDAASSTCRLYGNYNDQKVYCNIYNDIMISAVVGNPWVGFELGSRTLSGTNGLNVYKQNETTAQTLVVSGNTTTSVTVPSVRPFAVFATNEVGTIANKSNKRLSYVSAGRGLTAEQGRLYFNAVQQLRKNLGGGWI